jgi:hypothetical protein
MWFAELVTHISVFFCTNKWRLFRSINFYWIVNLHKNSAREGNNFTSHVENVSGEGRGVYRLLIIVSFCMRLSKFRRKATWHEVRCWNTEEISRQVRYSLLNYNTVQSGRSLQPSGGHVLLPSGGSFNFCHESRSSTYLWSVEFTPIPLHCTVV